MSDPFRVLTELHHLVKHSVSKIDLSSNRYAQKLLACEAAQPLPGLKPLADLVASVVAYISAKALKRRLVKKGSNNNFDLEVVDVDAKSEQRPKPTEEDNFQLTASGWKVDLEENYLDCEIRAETLLSDRRDAKRNSMPTVVPPPESSMSAKHSKAAGKARASRLIKSSFDRKDARLV